MLSPAAEFARLSLIVERLMDADLLLAEEGGALLEALAAAEQALENGHEAAVRRHAARFIQAMEALVQSRRLVEAHGRAALETARRMLEVPAG